MVHRKHHQEWLPTVVGDIICMLESEELALLNFIPSNSLMLNKLVRTAALHG
jgi:hypothetical protein